MLTEAVENLLNRNLGQSPRARELCRELQGQCLQVAIVGMPLQAAPVLLTIDSLGHSLSIKRGAAATPPAATLRGSPVNLLALTGGDPQGVIRRGAVQIEGDAELTQSYQQLLQCLRPDVEEELSRLIGDSPAHEMMRVARLALGFGKRAVDTGVRNTAEYLAHESGDLVSGGEADHFLDGVSRLREDVDRLEARISLLASRSGSAA